MQTAYHTYSSYQPLFHKNRRINDNLEQQAQVLFNHYFVDTPEILGDCTVGNLTDIALISMD